MRVWSSRTVVVILVALMVAMATPAMAADPALEVASENDSDTELSAGTLTNVQVVGSGDSATVDYDDVKEYGFENEPADSGVPDDLEAVTDPRAQGFTRNTDTEEVTTSQAASGSQSYHVVESTSGNVIYSRPQGQPYSSPITNEVSVSLYAPTNSDTVGIALYEGTGDTPQIRLSMDGGDLVKGFSGTVVTSVPDSAEWVRLRIYDIDPSTNTYDLDWSTPSNSGTVTDISMTSAMSSGYDSTVLTVNNEGYFDDFDYRSDLAANGTYIGDPHQVDEAQQGLVELPALTNTDATVTWQGSSDGGSSWSNINTNTYTSGGTKTVSLPSTYDLYRVQIEFGNLAGVSDASFDRDAVQFNAATPNVDNASASPSGGETVTSRTMTLSIDVSDEDFALAQSDSLTLEWYVDGTKQNTTTVTSNRTASAEVQTPGGSGSHTWHVVVTDSYGDTTTSNTFSFDSPSTLRVVNESNVSQLVDNVTVELTFYFRNGTGQDFSVTRTTSDGTVNMTGLPADQPFVVVAEADGFYSRRIFVPSLFETQTVYLLPENQTAVDTVFVIEDYTGDFPPDDTVLLVQRSLNGTWKTVLGDYFGATREFPGQVAYNKRHRLVLMNVETGETKVMGTYTPITAATQEVVVSPSGGLTVRTAGATASIRPQLGQLPALNATTVAVRFENNSASVANWTVNASVNGTVVWQQTYASSQRVTNNLDLANYAGQTLTVRVTYNDSNGTTYLVRERTFQIQQTLDNNATLLAVLQDFAQQSPSDSRDSFTAFLAMAITVLGMAGVATQFPVSGEAVALVGVFILTGFSVIGWVGYGLVFAAGVGTIAFAGLKRGL